MLHSGSALEPEVLPIFYYNDMLLGGVGETIGLNLFEPRYKEMCRRFEVDMRFLFMPNFQDYCCRAGDVGFVVQVTDLRSSGSGHGQCFGVRGVAIELVGVQSTWVEPNTQGLHYAQCYAMDKPPISPDNARALVMKLNLQHGWIKRDPDAYRERWGPSTYESENRIDNNESSLVLGCNFPGRIFISYCPGSSSSAHSVALNQFETVLQGVGIPKERILMRPPLVPGVLFEHLLSCLTKLWHVDASQSGQVSPSPTECVTLAPARVLQVGSTLACFESARIELLQVKAETSVDFADKSWPSEDQFIEAVVVSNKANVHFFAPKSMIVLTEDSVNATLARASFHWNRARLRIVNQGRDSAFASLPENILGIIYNFVCSNGAAAVVEKQS